MKIYSSALFYDDSDNDHHHQRQQQQQQYTTDEYINMDGSYLNSLLNSEDESHPDRDLVLLWCMRNGLQHAEVSAATGEGVDAAMEMLVRLALEEQKKKKNQQSQAHLHQQQQQPAPAPPPLDLDQRFSSSAATTQGNSGTISTITAAPATAATTTANGSSNNNNNNNDMPSLNSNPYQVQRRYPKLDLRERYTSKEDHKCFFPLFFFVPIVSQWFRGERR